MDLTEKQINIAHRMYQCRRTAWQIFGDGTPETLIPWQASIRAEMSETGKDELLSALSLAEKAKGQEREGVRIMLIMAAAVEMIEPTKGKEGKV